MTWLRMVLAPLFERLIASAERLMAEELAS
jgi:hypothetical protein